MTTTTTPKLLAFHGESAIKEKYLARLDEHRRLDHLTQGVGWKKNGKTKGCAIGCTLEAYDHARYPIELGIPETLAHLEDAIFEGLPREAALEWPRAVLDTIQVGADLELVWPQFALWLLTDAEHGALRFVAQGSVQERAIRGVANLHQRWISGEKPGTEEWSAAEDAAGDAAGDAAWAAAEAAAGAAARAAARAAAWAAHWQACADKLLELLRAAPVPPR